MGSEMCIRDRSTVYEVIAANHMGARVLGISCLTNLAAGILDQPLDHAEVKEAAGQARERFQRLLDAIITDLGALLSSAIQESP